MFSIRNKLDPSLKDSIAKKQYKTYRVIIYCKSIPESIEKKIPSYKGTIIHVIPLINCVCAILSPNAIDKVSEFPQVDYISLDFFAILCGKAVLSSNGVLFQEKYKLTGKNICIGLVDTGVYPHPDLLNPHNKIKAFLDIINKYHYPYDDNGHGTFISGILCGSGYLSKGMYKGVAENSSLYAIKAFNSIGKGYVSDILFAIQTLLSEKDSYNIKVICLPFELTFNNHFIISLFSNLFDIAIRNNIAVVVPAGHNGNNEGSISGIATLGNCITIGGVDTSSNIVKPYIYSSSGPLGTLEKPDLAAAAVDICSTNSNKKYISEKNGVKIYPQALDTPYTVYSGTSCAAAYISSICALLYENNPNLSFKDIVSLLKVSCNLTELSKWIQGSGVLDLGKLLP
ncbi:S8 family serine peptidase [Clostridium sp. DJ247]|uniref:S8 family serine peptidase n=1 Tax=Clostridium sp. DJ247 TaxID=2726188 RepID=UPI0016237A97|nr:S8 family serine peptidase [Clostridium sp. DJ247]MBC2580929.1 S8 family serine peptidase [Clostridium sp. DJ247]